MNPLKEALLTFIARQDIQIISDRHAKGQSVKLNGILTWIPDEAELKECCFDRADKMIHLNSIRHVATMYGVDMQDLKKAIEGLQIAEETASRLKGEDRGPIVCGYFGAPAPENRTVKDLCDNCQRCERCNGMSAWGHQKILFRRWNILYEKALSDAT